MKVLEKNGQVIEGNFEEKEVKEAFWHTSAHVLAQAVKRLYPDTKCAIGPAIDNGFYYDFDFSFPFTEENLASGEGGTLFYFRQRQRKVQGAVQKSALRGDQQAKCPSAFRRPGSGHLQKHEGSLGSSGTAATVLPLSRQLCGQPLLCEERGGAGSGSYHRRACAHQSAEAQGIYGGSGGLLGRYAVRGGISLEYRTG